MKIILDIDCYDDEDFELFKTCLEERKEILKSIKQFEEGKLNYDLNTLYKYSLVITLNKNIIVAIYKDNKKYIHIF